jgi:hypothetical protein
MTDVSKRKQVPWKRVQASSLSEASRGLYGAYVTSFANATEAAHALKDAVTKEWNGKYPEGIDGKAFIFTAIGGALHYQIVDKTKQKVENQFDENSGDNVFAHPRKTHTPAAAEVSDEVSTMVS